MRISNHFLSLTLPWVLAVVWIVLGEQFRHAMHLRKGTEQVIRDNDLLIQSYARKFGEAPPSLNELRLYAKMRGSQYQGFDTWGGRLEYLRLGRVNYTLRSFGADGVQNTIATDPDPGIFRWGQMVPAGLQYDYDAGMHQTRPSVILFAGADDDARKWHGKLFLDAATGARRLLIRSRKVMNLYMLAAHDGVEEFLWLPGGDRLVFTASGSSRYADGIWIWDLVKDQAWNVLQLNEKDRDLNPAQQARGLLLALSRVQAGAQPAIFAFVAPANGLPMNPEWFFHPQNLHMFKILGDESFEHLRPVAESAKLKSYFDYEWMGQSTLSSGGQGAALQRAWLRLPRSGSWESAMNVWQDYATAHAQSPLAAYAVWSLALFYRDAQLEARVRSAKEAEVLRGYSGELSHALSHMLVAPGWMRAVGAWMAAQNQ